MIKLIKEIRSRLGKLHFKRWRLLTTPWFSINLHYFENPDFDDHLHDHPWDFISVVLYGGYVESLQKSFDGPVCINKRKPLSIAYRKGVWFHKVIELYKPTYTLIFTTKPYREWGYNLGGIWVNNDQYRFAKHYKEKIEAFGTLEKGWDSYDADPPSKEAINNAIILYGNAAMLPDKISPTVVGGIAMYYDNMVFIELYNDGSNCVIWNYYNDLSEEMQIECSLTLDELITKLNEKLDT